MRVGAWSAIVLAGLVAVAMPAPVALGGDAAPAPPPLAQDHDLARAAWKFLRWAELDTTERAELRRADPMELVAALDRLPVRAPSTAGVEEMGVIVRGATWWASVRLPEGYDARRRHPLLVLPDGDTDDADAAFARFAGDPAFADVLLLRPEIDALRDDRARFPDAGALASALTTVEVLRQALVVARLGFAVDPERVMMFGRGRAASLAALYAVTFPDDLAAVVLDTAPAGEVRDACLPMLRNLAGVTVRSLRACRVVVTRRGPRDGRGRACDGRGRRPRAVRTGRGRRRERDARPSPRRRAAARRRDRRRRARGGGSRRRSRG